MNKTTDRLDSPGPAARFLHESKLMRALRYLSALAIFPLMAAYKMYKRGYVGSSPAGEYLTDVLFLGVLIPGAVTVLLTMIHSSFQLLPLSVALGIGLGTYLLFGIGADLYYRRRFLTGFL
jgi:hypothetical protein